MGLGEYRRKRDFSVTPEPAGGPTARRAKTGRSFVVQKHDASRLHYDFRLESDGVLKSWAVPKGPSLDPRDKRLAMQTEDHPIDYGGFEGIIPEGQYGGGAVMVWDRGTWEPEGDPGAGLRRGALKFSLNGRKLRGRWALVRMKPRERSGDGRAWLLIKEKDAHARRATRFTVVSKEKSVATGRSLDEIARARDRVWESHRAGSRRAARPSTVPARAPRTPHAARRRAADDLAAFAAALPGARPATFPKAVRLQLATLVTEPPGGDDWGHEIKLDGYRIVTLLRAGRARLLSRNGKDWTAHFPGIRAAIEAIAARDAVLDGEVAALLPDGRTSFQAMQNASTGAGGATLVYFLFDALHLAGHDLRGCALEARKSALRRALGGTRRRDRLRYSDHLVGSGDPLFERACRLGAEGIVSKRRDAPYEPGRGRAWLKVKCGRRQEFVIGGWTDASGPRPGIGALLLGVHDKEGRLVYAGKVGTGFSHATLADLQERLEPLARATPPFDRASLRGAPRAHWAEPRLIGEVSFTEWTSDGRLRHPSFQGLRSDKPPEEIVREEPKPTGRVAGDRDGAPGVPPSKAKAGAGAATRRPARAAATVAGVRLTHPDLVLYPELGLTKRGLAVYYESIAEWILPHVRLRPLTLVRCPQGRAGSCFYMKHAGVHAPEELHRVRIQEKTKIGDYLVVEDVRGLIALVQMGVLEIHTWNSVIETLERPDRVVFDLDPGPAVPWERVLDAARRIRDRLADLGLESFAKLSGGKGLHVVAPLRPPSGWDDSARFARAVAEEIERADPGRYTTDVSKAKRRGKILIDWLRNTRGNTTVAAYSTRARQGAPVSTPVAWRELGPALRPNLYSVDTLPKRLARLRSDPWARYLTVRQTIAQAARRAVGID